MKNVVLSVLFLACAPLAKAEISVPNASVMAASPEQSSSHEAFALGLGAGVDSFSGNMGDLIGSAATADIRGEWVAGPAFSFRVGGNFSGFGFNAAPYGATNVNLFTLSGAGQFHVISTAQSQKGFDPYAYGQVGKVFRTQTYLDQGEVAKDGAFMMGAGIGTNYRLSSQGLALWAEGGVGEILFPDRYSSQYAPSGIPDSTGLLLSGRLGVKYYF